MHKLPPLVKTEYRPEDLLGPEDQKFLLRHIEKWTMGQEAKLTARDRANALSMMVHMENHGYRQNGVRDGAIRWAQLLKSQKQQVMEEGLEPLKGLSRAQLSDYINRRVKTIG